MPTQAFFDYFLETIGQPEREQRQGNSVPLAVYQLLIDG